MVFRPILQAISTVQTPVLAFCCTFFSFFLISLTTRVEAVEVEDLYSATVIVSSREDERERDQAFSTGMREVLLKVSGSNESLAPNTIRRALNNPVRYVESWGWSSFEIEELLDSETSALPIDDGSAEILAENIIELEMSFYESEIRSLLENSNLPLWPANRPNTLLWVVMQEELGGREVLSENSETKTEVIDLIQAEAESRGFPLLFPLLDLEDQQSLNANKLWSLKEEDILAASLRYQSESILVLRIYQSLSGELLGKSLYLFRGRALPLESFDESLDEFIENAVALSAQELSSNYSILLSGVSGRGAETIINLEVEGIASVKAYAELLAYVDGLTDVNAYQIISVDQERMVLELATGGQLRQLMETIALERKLEPTRELDRSAYGIYLHYQWVE